MTRLKSSQKQSLWKKSLNGVLLATRVWVLQAMRNKNPEVSVEDYELEARHAAGTHDGDRQWMEALALSEILQKYCPIQSAK